MSNNKSVLIIGATGALGLQLLRHLASEPSVTVSALARNPSKFSDSDKRLCNTITTGNARNAQDIEKALVESKANYVILATGNGEDTSKSDTREKTGEALAAVVSKPNFSNVKVVIMSSHGAAETKIIVGFGIGMMISHHLRHVLADHTNQEAFFAGGSLAQRTLIVRPTALTDNKGGQTLVEFNGLKKGPSISADRSDVAAWVTEEIMKSPASFKGRKVCLTNAK